LNSGEPRKQQPGNGSSLSTEKIEKGGTVRADRALRKIYRFNKQRSDPRR